MFIAITVLAAAGGSEAKAGESAVHFKSVVELFTSQGCSSCPPADALLKTYVDRPDVVALSLPVDYWDYLGWKDTYAKSAHSERQRSYARKRGDGSIYTPQVVVNGIAHAVGSRADEIDQTIQRTRKALVSEQIPIKLDMDGEDMMVLVGAAREGVKTRSANIWLAMVLRKGDVSVRRGENGGRALSYYNVVRKMDKIGTWDGNAKSIRVTSDQIMQDGVDGCVVLVQEKRNGLIIAAAEIWP